MRILLVGPEREENLSVRYLSGALLAAGHEAEIAAFDSLDDLAGVVAAARGFDVVGLSMCFQARALEFLALAAALKQESALRRVIAGGHYATCAAEELLARHTDLDVIVLHEGERSLVALAAVGFDPTRLGSVPGIAFRDGGQVVRSGPRPIEADLDSLPGPDRRGRVRRLAGVPTAYVMGSRGCFTHCDYCCIVTLHRLAPGPRFRQRSVDHVADEMAALYHDRGIRQFVFHDDNFLVPSWHRNHERLDALQAAWHKRGLSNLLLALKCRPSEVEPTVFAKLKTMGLVRVFLGIESGSAAGLCSIGRRQEQADSERALGICRDLDISAQYTLMTFHPDATVDTVRADIDFFRRHDTHPVNFCRTEIYAGTPLERRMIEQGRARGGYLARTYSIADPVVDATARLAVRIFPERCWQGNSLMELAIGLDHLSAIARHVSRTQRVRRMCEAIDDWLWRTNHDLFRLLEDLLVICETTEGLEDPRLHRRVRALVAQERASRRVLLDEAGALRKLLRHATSQGPVATAAPGLRQRLLCTAAAATLAVTTLSCGGDTDHDGVSEYAATPMRDSDHDGLPDQCEEEIFGTDPELADTDGDGTPDGNENHDGGDLTNLEEQQQVGEFDCADVQDAPVAEMAPPPLVDTDRDGLPDQCELEIFGTDPELADTDGDGEFDGGENHDGGLMRNLDEQREIGPYRCGDVEDSGVAEAAPPPLLDTDDDGLPDQCEQEIFGTDPLRADTDGNGILDGDDDHDADGLTNLEEQEQAGGRTCVDIDD